MLIKNVKNGLFISLYAALLGAIQIYWFLPDGLSCIDAKSGLIDAIFFFITIQFILVLILFLVIKGKAKPYLIVSVIGVFWFLINKHEFTYRYACWSTFSESDILYYTIQKSLMPIIVCLIVFIIGNIFLEKLLKKNDFGSFKK